jgi:hypothetical protein
VELVVEGIVRDLGERSWGGRCRGRACTLGSVAAARSAQRMVNVSQLDSQRLGRCVDSQPVATRCDAHARPLLQSDHTLFGTFPLNIQPKFPP